MKEISLSQGKVAIVDDEDYEMLLQYRWHYGRNRSREYAFTNLKNKAGIWTTKNMHTFVLVVPTGFQVDHKSGNGLDNRKANLRIATNAENARNRQISKRNIHGYKGISRYSFRGYKWRADIRANYKHKFLGGFFTKEEAARAYDEAAIRYFGEFAYLNFPKEARGE